MVGRCYCGTHTPHSMQLRRQPAAAALASPSAASTVLLLLSAALLAGTASAVSAHIPAQVHAPHHGSSGPGATHTADGHAAHPHAGDSHQAADVHAQHTHAGDSHQAAAAVRVHPHPHLKGPGSISTGSGGSFTHTAKATNTAHKATSGNAADTPGTKPTDCTSWSTAPDAEDENLDRPYGINPETGREVEEEDVAEAEIAAAAKKAGMQPIEYENNSGEVTHMANPHHLAHLDSESAYNGFRLSYMLSIFFKTSSASHDVLALTEFSSSGNHALLDPFAAAVKDAIWDMLPDGIAEIKAVNIIPGNPLDLDIVVYPDLMIPDEINPSEVLIDTDITMHHLVLDHLDHEFLHRYSIDEIVVQANPQNGREIRDCEEVFPLPEGHHFKHHAQHTGQGSSGLRRVVQMALFVVCPVLLGLFIAARALLGMHNARQRVPMLVKSFDAAGQPGVANIFAAPMDYYAGPYRNVYSSGGGGSGSGPNSCRSSVPGSSSGGVGNGSAGGSGGLTSRLVSSPFQPYSQYNTPESSEGGAAAQQEADGIKIA